MSPFKMSKIESTMRVVLNFNEAFNHHDVDGMMKLLSDDSIFDNTYPPPDGTLYSGKQSVTKFWRDFFQQSPNAHIDIEEIFGLGSRCVMRWRYSWADSDDGREYVRGVDIFKVKDGLITEKLSYVKG